MLAPDPWVLVPVCWQYLPAQIRLDLARCTAPCRVASALSDLPYSWSLLQVDGGELWGSDQVSPYGYLQRVPRPLMSVSSPIDACETHVAVATIHIQGLSLLVLLALLRPRRTNTDATNCVPEQRAMCRAIQIMSFNPYLISVRELVSWHSPVREPGLSKPLAQGPKV